MGLFDRNKRIGGFMDEIRCDESSYLIWKWHPSGAKPDSNRENAIRWGSSLRVKDGSVAAFVYKQKNGVMQDFIEGPYDQIIKTANFPVLASIVGLAYEGGTPFQAEIYFINLAQVVQVKFAVPFFDVFDSRFPDFGAPVAVRGTISFRIADYKAFIKLHRLDHFSTDDFQLQIKDAVARYVKNAVANAPSEYNIPVVQLERRTMQISEIVENGLQKRLSDDFGVEVSGVDIGVIEIDKDSDGYRQLMKVTQEMSSATVQAQTDVAIKEMQDKQRIEAENYAEMLRIQREEAQYAQRMQTRTSNFGAFQVEKQAEVGVAGANALGKMGENGAANMNMDGGNGFNMAAMMTSMAIGGAVGQNVAGTINNMMGGMNQQPLAGAVPPPIPSATYHVAVNGRATGPFDIPVLAQMAAAGQFAANSLVWRNGMAQWVAAGQIDELKHLFADQMPPIPPTVR